MVWKLIWGSNKSINFKFRYIFLNIAFVICTERLLLLISDQNSVRFDFCTVIKSLEIQAERIHKKVKKSI